MTHPAPYCVSHGSHNERALVHVEAVFQWVEAYSTTVDGLLQTEWAPRSDQTVYFRRLTPAPERRRCHTLKSHEKPLIHPGLDYGANVNPPPQPQSANVGALDGEGCPQCRMLILRNGNVECLCRSVLNVTCRI